MSRRDRLTRKPLAASVQLRLDGGLEWREVRKGLYQATDDQGRMRAHIVEPEPNGDFRWWRVLVEGEKLPYDHPTLQDAKAFAQGLVIDQDGKQGAA